MVGMTPSYQYDRGMTPDYAGNTPMYGAGGFSPAP
jgi:hypothetical protein